MGAAWCRHRAERARDPKSPLDRVIVRCVDKFYSVDPGATPVRIPKPTPGGVGSPLDVDAMDIVPLHSVHRETGGPTRLAAGASPWQKASLQVPRSEGTRQTTSVSTCGPVATPSAADTDGDAADSSTTSEDAPSAGAAAPRAPVPPPRRKRQAKRKVGVTRPPPPRPPSISEPAKEQQKQQGQEQPIMHLLSPPKPRPKNTSTVSLPEWRDLELPESPPQPPRPASTSPRPQYLRPPSLTSVSESTLERVETYLRRCRSFGSMPSGELVDKLSSIDADSDGDDDPWEAIDDFEHAFQPAKGSPPHTPRSRLDGRSRRSGVVSASTPVSGPKTSTSKPTREITTPSPPPSPLPENGETRGRFFVSSPEDDWFNREYQREAPPATANGPEKDLSEVKKELQSIIYDYNRTKKISTSCMEVLPTQPIRTTPKKKKISVASLTPPPSPVASDLEDESTPSVPPSAVINGEANADGNTHSTLLRLLRECQNIEGALEQMEVEENDMPEVHSALRNMCENNRHLKETSKHTLRSLDSGLDVRGSLERAQEPPSAADATETKKNVDSGVDESDDLLAPQRPIKAALGDAPPPPPPPARSSDAESAVMRRKREARHDDDGGSSSGRSSMTPSLSELEAALSDMLEKSAAAGDDDRASPIPPERMEAAKTAVAAASAAGTPGDVAAPAPHAPSADHAPAPAPAEPAPALMSIPKISVTHDNAPSVH